MTLEAHDHFRIMVCIDGSDEAYRAMRFAAAIGSEPDVDIILVYLRPADQGLRSGGLQVRVARENMLKWGLELPGIKYLKKGRDHLIELGVMEKGWTEKTYHLDVENDPLGDNKITYTSPEGKQVVLKLKVAHDITTGILEQWEIAPYDLILLGASERWRTRTTRSFFDPAVAEKIAMNVPCAVLVGRGLSTNNGYLLCVDGSEVALEAARKGAVIAHRNQSEITVLAVAEDPAGEDLALSHVKATKAAIESLGVSVLATVVRQGDPVEEIVDEGREYSVVVVADSGKSTLNRFFRGSVCYDVMHKSETSVLIMR